MIGRVDESTFSWTALGWAPHLASAGPSMETYGMISCRKLLSAKHFKCLLVSLQVALCSSWTCVLVNVFLLSSSPAGMIEGTPQLHVNAWKVSSACISPVNIPIIDPCEMNQQNGIYVNPFAYHS